MRSSTKCLRGMHCSTHSACHVPCLSSNPDAASLVSCHLPRCIFHSLYVLAHCFVMVCVLLGLAIHLELSHELSAEPSLDHCSYLINTPWYLPVPHSSISPALNKLNYIWLLSRQPVSLGLQCFLPRKLTTSSVSSSHRRTEFLLMLVLLLAGDINLNPGPAPTHSLNFANLNIRSASTVTPDLNKPAVLQDFITDQNIDILALSETWLSPDSSLPTLNSLTPANFSLITLHALIKLGAALHLSTVLH
jgi:hypothetical protein